jgi:hypothetical protein
MQQIAARVQQLELRRTRLRTSTIKNLQRIYGYYVDAAL